METVLVDIAAAFIRTNGIGWDDATALVKKTWNGVTLNRMHTDNNPAGGYNAWTVPMMNGMLIEIPDQDPDPRHTLKLWDWGGDIQKTKWAIAHELGHSWDFRGTNLTKYLGGYNGGPLSAGLVTAVGGDATWCFGLLWCTGYFAGPETPVGGRGWPGSNSPAEDWGSSFAQFAEPMSGLEYALGAKRAQYVAAQIALTVSQ